MSSEESRESQWELGEEDQDDRDDQEESIPSSAWDTDNGWVENVHTWKLRDLIDVGYPVSTNERNEGRTGIHVFPKGMRLCLDEIVDHSQNLSLTKLEKIAYCHGLAIVTHKPEVIELCRLYKEVRTMAKEENEFNLIDELEVKSDAYKFARDAPSSATSIGILHDRDGMVSRLSRRLGMTNSKLYPCLILVSLMTWEDKLWQKKLSEEKNRFWGHVNKRLDRLRDLSKNNKTTKQ